MAPTYTCSDIFKLHAREQYIPACACMTQEEDHHRVIAAALQPLADYLVAQEVPG